LNQFGNCCLPLGSFKPDICARSSNAKAMKDRTPSTASVRKLTGMLTKSPVWIVALVPVLDGVVVAWKK
jgi:predicted O-methyltransferase YrrM